MGISYLILVIFQVASVAALAALWVKITKIQNQEDQRLSKGLQLLQSKLAVLEDLSDRTDVQVNQLVAILEGKIKEIQFKLIDADKVIGKIEQNISKSLEVANIFQDKIPHQEILERQYTKKYIKAAQLAHSGHSIEEIANVVEMTRGEIELIVKMNREKLQFDTSELPEWAKGGIADQHSQEVDFSIPTIFESKSEPSPLRNLETAFEMPVADNNNLKKLGEQFRTAMASGKTVSVSAAAPVAVSESVLTSKASLYVGMRKEITDNKLINTFAQFFDTGEVEVPVKSAAVEEVIMQGGKKMTVKPFQFKRIDGESHM